MNNFLNLASKDLMSEFLYASLNRVLAKELWGNRNTPQGVSVYLYHPESDSFEYLFTKDDRLDFKRDDPQSVIAHLHSYANKEIGGLVLYMHSSVVPIVSKHRAHPY